MSWSYATIGDVCDLYTGGTPDRKNEAFYDNGEVPWLVSGDIHNSIIRSCKGRITELGLKNSAAKYLPENSVLIALNGQGKTRGTVARLKMKATCNQSLVAISPQDPDRIDSNYLFHNLRARYQEIRHLTGSQGNERRGLNMGLINQIRIPLPPITEQRRIAAILDAADALCAKRRAALAKLDTLAQSIFIEMFGDPATNPMEWKVGTVRDLLEEAKYGTSAKANTEGVGLPILRMGNITYDGKIDLTDLKHVELANDEFEKYTTKPGDILFNRTNSKELVGKTAVVMRDEPLAIAGYLVRARTNERGNPHYISAYLNSAHGKATLRNMCKNIVGMANINAQEFQNISIALPPKNLQDEFAAQVARLDSARMPMGASEDELNTLFASLQQRAFRGELTAADEKVAAA